MEKTRDLFKKSRDTKGTFHPKMGSIKDRNDMDLTDAEDMKRRWQEYTESESESEVAQLCLTLSAPWTAAHQAPPSLGFSRQEYWSGVPLPSPSFSLLLLNSPALGKHYFALCFSEFVFFSFFI